MKIFEENLYLKQDEQTGLSIISLNPENRFAACDWNGFTNWLPEKEMGFWFENEDVELAFTGETRLGILDQIPRKYAVVKLKSNKTF